MTCRYCDRPARWRAVILGLPVGLCPRHMLTMYRDHYDMLDEYSNLRTRARQEA